VYVDKIYSFVMYHKTITIVGIIDPPVFYLKQQFLDWILFVSTGGI
jgi:hypothetical protein